MKKIIFIAITLLVINVNSTIAQVAWGGRVGFSSYTETVKTSGISFSGSTSRDYNNISINMAKH